MDTPMFLSNPSIAICPGGKLFIAGNQYSALISSAGEITAGPEGEIDEEIKTLEQLVKKFEEISQNGKEDLSL